MSEESYGPPGPSVPGPTAPPTQRYLLRPRNGAGVAALVLGILGLVTGILALALGVFLTVRVGTFFERHTTDFNNLSRCLNNASTNQERTDCADRFINDINNR